MRRILIVGAGQAGTQLALGLQAHGYDVTLLTERSPAEIRGGRVTSTQCMFAGALGVEREQRLNFWEHEAPMIEGVGLTVVGEGGEPEVDWVGRLHGYAQSVDQRVKMAGWLEVFQRRGGRLVVHAATLSDLDWFSREHELLLVATGTGQLGALFPLDTRLSPYDKPQRQLAAAYLDGLLPRDRNGFPTVHCNVLPGAGEVYLLPCLTLSGAADIVFVEAVPGGPLDVFDPTAHDPGVHLNRMLDLLRRHLPWEYHRTRDGVRLTDERAVLSGSVTPAVRHPVAELPGGGLVLGAADAVVANDPITGQGANNAAWCAASYLSSILEHGERPYDAAFLYDTFTRYWERARHVTWWTNEMLRPMPEYRARMLAAGNGTRQIADRYANGFDDPADLRDWFLDEASARAYLTRLGLSG